MTIELCLNKQADFCGAGVHCFTCADTLILLTDGQGLDAVWDIAQSHETDHDGQHSLRLTTFTTACEDENGT